MAGANVAVVRSQTLCLAKIPSSRGFAPFPILTTVFVSWFLMKWTVQGQGLERKKRLQCFTAGMRAPLHRYLPREKSGPRLQAAKS